MAMERGTDRCVPCAHVSTQHPEQTQWPGAITATLISQMCVTRMREEMTHGRLLPRRMEQKGQMRRGRLPVCSFADALTGNRSPALWSWSFYSTSFPAICITLTVIISAITITITIIVWLPS